MISRRSFLGGAIVASLSVPFAPKLLAEPASTHHADPRYYDFLIYGNYEPFRDKLGRGMIASAYLLGDPVKPGDPNVSVWKDGRPWVGSNFDKDEKGVYRHIIGYRIIMSVDSQTRDHLLSASCSGEEYRRELLKKASGLYREQVLAETYPDTVVVCEYIPDFDENPRKYFGAKVI